jgi:hypothetical protein
MMGTAIAAASCPRVRPLLVASDVVFNPEFDPALDALGDVVDEVDEEVDDAALLLLVTPPAPKNPTADDVVVEAEEVLGPKTCKNPGSVDDVVRAVPVLVLRMVLTIVVLDVRVPVTDVEVVVLNVVKIWPTPFPASAPKAVVAAAVCDVVPSAVKPKNGVPVVNGSPKNGLPAIGSDS